MIKRSGFLLKSTEIHGHYPANSHQIRIKHIWIHNENDNRSQEKRSQGVSMVWKCILVFCRFQNNLLRGSKTYYCLTAKFHDFFNILWHKSTLCVVAFQIKFSLPSFLIIMQFMFTFLKAIVSLKNANSSFRMGTVYIKNCQ